MFKEMFMLILMEIFKNCREMELFMKFFTKSILVEKNREYRITQIFTFFDIFKTCNFDNIKLVRQTYD